MSAQQPLGSFGWMDLTVDDAPAIRDFYQDVAGWTTQSIPMSDDKGAYEDFVMLNSAGGPVGGVCHRRGGNSDLPPAWILYITVDDLAASVERAKARGAQHVTGPKNAGEHGSYHVLKDPAGASFALFQSKSEG